MRIQMKKFGTLLNGRPSAREAFLRLRQIINGSIGKDIIIIDFQGVEILTPSYADELLQSLQNEYGTEKIQIENTESNTVKETLEAVQLVRA